MVSVSIRLQEIDDDQLEEFIDIWADRKAAGYFSVERVGKANDKGRDVIGFMSTARHEGDWDLFQCKRKTRGASLGLPEAMGELGKVFHHHVEGAYATLPRQFVFVSPRGIAGPLKTILENPSRIGPQLIQGWDDYCRKKITKRVQVDLTPEIRKAIEGFDFKNVGYLTASMIAKDPHAGPALSKILELIPDEAPEGQVPDGLEEHELPYLSQLLHVYGQATGSVFTAVEDVLLHAQHGDHLRLQRTRYFEAAAFDKFHRDNTAPGAVDTFKNDVYHSVIEVYREPHVSPYARVDAVMKHSAMVQLALRGRLSRPPVRQGMCHHLVADGKLEWHAK